MKQSSIGLCVQYILLYAALENDAAYGQILLIQKNDAGFLADLNAAGPVVDADCRSRVEGGGPYRIRKGNAKFHGLAQAAHKAGYGACKGFGMAFYGSAVAA